MSIPLDVTGIPVSSYWQVYNCGECPNGHLIFFDENDKPIAHATISAAQARRLAKQIEKKDPNFREIGDG